MFDKEIIKKGCKYGFPPAIQSGVAACGNIALKNFMNGFGTQTAAAITTRLQSGFDNTYAHNKFKLGNFNNNGTKQGRKKRPSHKAVFKCRILLMLIISGVLSAVMCFFGGNIVSIFGMEENAASIGAMFFESISIFYVFFEISNTLRGTAEGVGDLLFSVITGICSLGVRIAFSYISAESLGNMSIAYAEGLQWIFLFAVYFLRIFQKRKIYFLQKD